MGNYCVYVHTFPNGKHYVGISKNAETRWNNGHGYDTQPKMKNAISKYGWQNINHAILIDGISEEKAKDVEMSLIAILDSIKNGYNVSIGGDYFNSYYLDSYVSAMICSAKRYYMDTENNSIVALADGDKMSSECAGFWNEASRAVIQKHGLFSLTDAREVSEYWYYIGQYYNLYCLMEDGADISTWHEIPYEQAVYDCIFNRR